MRASRREMPGPGLLLRTALIGAQEVRGALGGVILGLCFAQGGRPTGDVGLFFGAYQILATLALGWHLGRASRLSLIAVGVATYSASLALLPVLSASPTVWLPILPAGLSGGLVYTLVIATLQDLMRDRPGAGFSLIAVQRVAAEGLPTADPRLDTCRP